MAQPIARGTVASLARWPVKSLGGEDVRALRVDARGAGGDRTHALHDVRRDRRLTAREAPGLLRWHAAYPDQSGDVLDPADPPTPRVTGPDGVTYDWDDPAFAAAIGADVGFEVRTTRDLAGQQDLERSLLLTTQASLDALGAELDNGPLDLRRFRPNVHVVLDVDAFAEVAYEGATVRIGDAVTEALHPCVRCVIPTRDPDTGERDARILRHLAREHETVFGINLRPLGAATIRTGDPVTVEPAKQGARRPRSAN